MLEIVQRDYEKAKIDLTSYCQRLNDCERDIDEKMQDLKRSQESIVSLENKNSSLRKEYDKFKESVSEALSSSFAQIVQAFFVEKADNTKASMYGSNEPNTVLKRGLADFSNDLVSAINLAGRESKGLVNRLT
jgi:translation initiation factor 2 alpha subunit (eIF-2alpha)